MIVLRPYQIEAADSVYRDFADLDSTMLIMATGTGKTVTFAEVVRRWLATESSRVLILAHRYELIRQAHGTLRTMLQFAPQIEMGARRATHSTGLGNLFAELEEDRKSKERVVIASVQTLWQEKRLQEFDPDQFGLVIVDEAHHCVPQAKTYWRIREHFGKAKWLGVTATPKRADELALGQAFESVAFEFGIQRAVEEAYLVPVEQQFVEVQSLDLSKVSTSGDDFKETDLARAMTHDEQTSWKVAAATVEHFGEEPTLVFTCPRAPGEPESQGEQVARALNRIKPKSAVHLTGETHPDIRKARLDEYAAGRFQYLVGCDLFTEGFDSPRISRVVMARPTKSIVYYTQAIGRGTRPLPGVLLPEHDTPEKREKAIAESAKPKMVVLDFVGNSGTHKLVSCVDIFAGKHSELAKDKALSKAKKAGGPVDISGLLQLAERELAREEEERQERIRAQVRYRVEEVDPFATSALSTAARKTNTSDSPATASQVSWIKAHGGILEPGATVAAAGAVIADIKRRWHHGLCSQKQQRTLERLGWADGPIPKTHAKALCDFLSQQGWPRCRQPLERRHLSLKRDGDKGWRLAIHGIPVGSTYPTQDAVRAAYEGIVASEPVAA